MGVTEFFKTITDGGGSFFRDIFNTDYVEPGRVRVYNGAEMKSKICSGWCERQKIQIVCIHSGKPSKFEYIELFMRFLSTGRVYKPALMSFEPA